MYTNLKQEFPPYDAAYNADMGSMNYTLPPNQPYLPAPSSDMPEPAAPTEVKKTYKKPSAQALSTYRAEFEAIWAKDHRLPTAVSRQAWAEARGLGEKTVGRWWSSKRNAMKAAGLNPPRGAYKLAVGVPPTLEVVEPSVGSKRASGAMMDEEENVPPSQLAPPRKKSRKSMESAHATAATQSPAQGAYNPPSGSASTSKAQYQYPQVPPMTNYYPLFPFYGPSSSFNYPNELYMRSQQPPLASQHPATQASRTEPSNRAHIPTSGAVLRTTNEQIVDHPSINYPNEAYMQSQQAPWAFQHPATQASRVDSSNRAHIPTSNAVPQPEKEQVSYHHPQNAPQYSYYSTANGSKYTAQAPAGSYHYNQSQVPVSRAAQGRSSWSSAHSSAGASEQLVGPGQRYGSQTPSAQVPVSRNAQGTAHPASRAAGKLSGSGYTRIPLNPSVHEPVSQYAQDISSWSSAHSASGVADQGMGQVYTPQAPYFAGPQAEASYPASSSVTQPATSNSAYDNVKRMLQEYQAQYGAAALQSFLRSRNPTTLSHSLEMLTSPAFSLGLSQQLPLHHPSPVRAINPNVEGVVGGLEVAVGTSVWEYAVGSCGGAMEDVRFETSSAGAGGGNLYSGEDAHPIDALLANASPESMRKVSGLLDGLLLALGCATQDVAGNLEQKQAGDGDSGDVSVDGGVAADNGLDGKKSVVPCAWVGDVGSEGRENADVKEEEGMCCPGPADDAAVSTAGLGACASDPSVPPVAAAIAASVQNAVKPEEAAAIPSSVSPPLTRNQRTSVVSSSEPRLAADIAAEVQDGVKIEVVPAPPPAGPSSARSQQNAPFSFSSEPRVAADVTAEVQDGVKTDVVPVPPSMSASSSRSQQNAPFSFSSAAQVAAAFAAAAQDVVTPVPPPVGPFSTRSKQHTFAFPPDSSAYADPPPPYSKSYPTQPMYSHSHSSALPSHTPHSAPSRNPTLLRSFPSTHRRKVHCWFFSQEVGPPEVEHCALCPERRELSEPAPVQSAREVPVMLCVHGMHFAFDGSSIEQCRVGRGCAVARG